MRTTSFFHPQQNNLSTYIERERLQFSRVTYAFGLAMILAAAFLVPISPEAALMLTALALGWSEVDGLCGIAHYGSITPQYALDKKLWFRSVSAYTVAGIGTAALTGWLVGTAGDVIFGLAGFDTAGGTAYVVLACVASLLALREFDSFWFVLPQWHRQTVKAWAYEYGFVIGAGMWGGHIGFGLLTVITHGGLFALVILALMWKPQLAAGLFVVFWIGRTLPLWTAPYMTCSPNDGDLLFAKLERASKPCCHIAALGLLAMAGVSLAIAARQWS